MLEELRWSLRAPAARPVGGCPGASAATDVGVMDPHLSTGFADGGRWRSTGAHAAIHRGVATYREEVD